MAATAVAPSLFGEPHALYADGVWAYGDEAPIEVLDPTTEQTLAVIPAASLQQVDRALSAARRAFDEGPWSRTTGLERGELLHDLADRFERELPRFAELLVAEVGTPVSLVDAVHLTRTLDLLRWFADAAVTGPRGAGYEQTLTLHRVPRRAASILRSEPAGVVSAITAYNVPLLMLVCKLGGALAAGCTVVLMPSPRTPLSTIAFFRLLEQTDIPAGVANLVVGEAAVGERLTTAPEVDMITFTGSRRVGELVMQQASRGLKKVVLELGGKSPNILLPGADVAAAIGPSILRFALNAGQACGATTRTFVARSDYHEYVNAAQAFLAGVNVGDPRAEETQVGPLIRAEHRASVQGYVDRALDAGAVIEAGVPRARDHGYFFDPLLIGGVDNHAEISREELFGPVGVLIPYDDVGEAIRLSNDSAYGLNANVWGPTEDALAVARRLRSGNVTINGGGGVRHDVPWGGFRQSGIGRDMGEAGFAEFLEVKHMQWPT